MELWPTIKLYKELLAVNLGLIHLVGLTLVIVVIHTWLHFKGITTICGCSSAWGQNGSWMLCKRTTLTSWGFGSNFVGAAALVNLPTSEVNRW